jgi:hypothetical protein
VGHAHDDNGADQLGWAALRSARVIPGEACRRQALSDRGRSPFDGTVADVAGSAFASGLHKLGSLDAVARAQSDDPQTVVVSELLSLS